MEHTVDLLNKLDLKRQEQRHADLHQLVEFRQRNQQPSTRREWDLNDPQRLQKDLPARVHDEDPRCGVSSLQKFHGEDLLGMDRERLQKMQVRAWAYEGRLAKERKRRDEESLKLYVHTAAAGDVGGTHPYVHPIPSLVFLLLTNYHPLTHLPRPPTA